jgi:flagellar hook-associated protein 1 FlgK
MSTFSGLSTALSSLIAQRQALGVAGQNIANANTAGYTRQRADLHSVASTAVASLHSTPLGAGSGVTVEGITRMSDQFLDARLRLQTAQSSDATAVATALTRLEGVVKEPSSTGLASGLQEFWDAWQDVANSPDSTATRTVAIGTATTLTTQIADTYRAFESQWDQGRAEADSLVSRVNATAAAVAELNGQIRGVLVSGGSAGELMDRRDSLITELSSMVGGTAKVLEDGTVNVMVAGNPLVQGDRASAITVQGSSVMTAATTEPPVAGDVVRLEWANGTPLNLSGGSLAGTVTSLQPGSLGGPIANAVSAINALATQVAGDVNALHSTGTTLAAPPDDTGIDFFSFAAGTPAALGLTVAVTDPAMVAAAAGGTGEFDGSLADRISQLGEGANGPDATWRAFVVDLGVATSAAERRAEVAEVSRASAENQQLANSSVDIDEEMTNMLAYQRAYEGAARVLTAVDEMLDVLINRTGIVGR